jgi:polyisoprenoid-binding protein YceI
MHKLALATAAAIAAFSAPAMAASQNWNVTEEHTSGVKNGQGTWAVTIDGDKLTGSASLQLDNGKPLTYSLEGTIKDSVYTVKLDKRSDDKKGCVWTGHAQTVTAAGKATGYIGDLVCDGTKLIIRAIGM